MGNQIAALVAEVASLKAATASLTRTTAETFSFLTIPLMILIHVGFLSCEMGASRAKTRSPRGSRTSASPPLPSFRAALSASWGQPKGWHAGWLAGLGLRRS